jgi:hypothetical protein
MANGDRLVLAAASASGQVPHGPLLEVPLQVPVVKSGLSLRNGNKALGAITEMNGRRGGWKVKEMENRVLVICVRISILNI